MGLVAEVTNRYRKIKTTTLIAIIILSRSPLSEGCDSGFGRDAISIIIEDTLITNRVN